MTGYFAHKDLMKPPGKRAAYSDRTSYMMAEMSRLAYFKFEGGSNLDEVIEGIDRFLPRKADSRAIKAFLKSTIAQNSPNEARAILERILKEHDFDLYATYNKPSTGAQGFLCKCDKRKIAILAFRGTETSLKDIKADIKALLTPVDSKGNDGSSLPPEEQTLIHSGYLGQFNSLKDEISRDLESVDIMGHQLFITGHSLGGALAVTATKFLAGDVTGACYTFGSPPVGTKGFDRDIKTPIYRIINHVDIVPRLPNPVLVYLIRVVAWVIEALFAPFVGISSTLKESALYKKVRKLLIDAQKYRQSGYGSYLVENGKHARLRYSVHMGDKLEWWAKQIRFIGRGKFLFITEHSIDEYSEKLATWAESRKDM